MCDQAWMRHVVQAAFFLGWLGGSAGFSWLADEFGA